MNEFTYAPVTTPPPAPAATQHGYWLVGSDGGIFTFGSAQFYGSTGSLHLQRPVVGITPTADRGGYWLVASDGGIFAFGDSGFYGSIPGSGLKPAGSGHPHSLNAPIVGHGALARRGRVLHGGVRRRRLRLRRRPLRGLVPGHRRLQGRCGVRRARRHRATATGSSRTSAPCTPSATPSTTASRARRARASRRPRPRPNGGGYWILDAAGQVFPFGNAASLGGMPPGSAGGFNPASAIFATSDGGGYWVVTAAGKVSSFGDAPADGDMSATHLNGPIVAASGS